MTLAAASGTTAGTVLLHLGAVLFGLGVLGLVAHRCKVSPVPLYLLAGLAFGEHGPVPLTGGEGGEQFITVGAELGAVLLLFMLGLEYAADELVAGLRHNTLAGLVDLILNAVPGAAVALLLGWGPVAAVAMAGVTYVSSSGIVAKLLADFGQLGNRETPTVIAVLVLEDLAMAGYLPVLTAMVSGLSVLAATGSLGLALAAVTAVFLLAIRAPELLSRLVFAPNDEVLLLRVLGLTLLVAGLAAQMNVSATVGAFLVGVALSGPIAHSAAQLLRPLRDLFAAVFFMFFGLQIDPTQIPDVLLLAVALALVTSGTKVATGWWAAGRAGIGGRGRLRAGVALVPRGEFSIVIAGLTTASADAGAFTLDPRFGALAATYVLLLAILGPVAARLVSGRRPRHGRPAPELAQPRGA
ncbi:cation:proton antiporter [Blastococcus sp. CT_GayMR20]|uniref:cation:proton antiporter n=1 Tax=Blastococcus sp. CT_GayMR20 TaxID=2559609 RepID=UPI0010742529|nr:cation:proton antiporter [Blastococcus sp. CT_GayMR20]TFV88460.1 cation:proton antiporter [Blastococcus sp. CT_GayMR20]